MNNFSEKDSEKVFISDCEGPISKNDNAFEISKCFIPDGGRFFTLLSRYDDVKSEILQVSDYESGSTLKFILPFLKAYGATDEKLLKYSSENMSLVPGASRTLDFVNSLMPAFIVSTSYEQYIRALCNEIDFPFQNTYSTKLNLDKYQLKVEEKSILKEIREKMRDLNRIKIPDGVEKLEDFPPESRRTIRELDIIFGGKIPELEVGKMIKEVEPVGGGEKVQAVRDISQKLGSDFDQIMYLGDSITDVEAFRFLRKNDGLTISFNGNKYAVRNADVIVLAKNTIITSLLAYTFNLFGKEKVLELVKNWSHETIKKTCQNEKLLKNLLDLYPQKLPLVKTAEEANMRKLKNKSSRFRKKVRGERKGELG